MACSGACPSRFFSDIHLTRSSQFKAEASQQRSNLSSRVRRQAGTAIFACGEDDLKTPEIRRQKFGELIGLSSAGLASYSPYNVPVLHETGSGRLDIHTVFLNRSLMKVSVHLSVHVCC